MVMCNSINMLLKESVTHDRRNNRRFDLLRGKTSNLRSRVTRQLLKWSITLSSSPSTPPAPSPDPGRHDRGRRNNVIL
jgi:hypothetical protein